MSKGKPHEEENPVISAVGYSPPIRLPYGWASVVLSGERLVSVEWEDTWKRLADVLSEKYPHAVENSRDRSGAGQILKEYAGGEILSPRKVSALPVAWERIAGFHGKVLRETAKIPYGRTFTYGELATRAGSPGAARATGAALARNPWPILVPCHRVVGEGGKLVGFGKGLPAKEALLRFEERNLLLRKSCPIKRQNV
jgi:methylated-DNA-[protein]-cysteine S-methyltransferase